MRDCLVPTAYAAFTHSQHSDRFRFATYLYSVFGSFVPRHCHSHDIIRYDTRKVCYHLLSILLDSKNHDTTTTYDPLDHSVQSEHDEEPRGAYIHL